ncbi:hypothetical protein CDAR_459121 [Caerostris darwini]|uniref:Histone H2A n=1 Tax=Caerostris darwini TaxID=1538125 RepID=A0AAV4M7P3_9ARAC|nr:hypothetical protein CDAR_459121 [Caerostris darwini]
MSDLEKEKTTKKISSGKRTKHQSSKPLFPLDEIYTMLKKKTKRGKIAPQVPLYLGSVYEYITAEILEKAGNHAIRRKSNVIEAIDIIATVTTDPELNEAIGKAITETNQS